MKILGIGPPRTGTMSLTRALEYLGYSTRHAPNTLQDIDEHEALTEVHTQLLFPITTLLERYPDSKFIYTLRDYDDWLLSCKKFSITYKPFYKEFWRLQDRWKNIFDEQFQESKQIPPEKILYMNICEGEGWEKLCPFLGKEIPNIPFFNRNSSKKLLLL